MSMVQIASDVFRWIGGAVVPMVVKPTNPVPLAWFLHVILVVATCVGLVYVQPILGITGNVGQGPGWLRPYWLTALFLLIYPLVWAACWLFQLLKPNQLSSAFPDIDDAWAEIAGALEKSGIGIADTPVILVLGEQPSGFEPMFRALPNGLIVAGGSSPSSPLRVYANRDAIYITLSGASLLGVQDASVMLTPADSDQGQGSVFQSIGVNQSVGIGASVSASIGASIGGGGGGALMEIQKIIRKAKTENRPLSEDERTRVRELSGSPAGGGAAPAANKPANMESVLQNPQIVGAAAERLIHVCELLSAARWPLCPINGTILAVPASAAERDDHAQQWGLVARQDLAVLEYGLRLKFPVYALVGGIENIPGGTLFFDRFSVDKGNQRLGKGFPINPDVRLEDFPTAVEANVSWVFQGLLSYWSYKLARVDGKDNERETKENTQLVRFLAEIRKRGGNLSRLLSRAFTPYDAVPEFGGCYLSVVLPSEPDKAKFAREFFKKVETTQGYVSWTGDAFAEDASFRAKTKLGYLAAFAIIGFVIALTVYVVFTKFMK